MNPQAPEAYNQTLFRDEAQMKKLFVINCFSYPVFIISSFQL
jgi:hypothetical protein